MSGSKGYWRPAGSEFDVPPVKITFLVIALVFAVVSARDYFDGGRRLTLRSKIFLRMAAIFAVVSAYLFWRG